VLVTWLRYSFTGGKSVASWSCPCPSRVKFKSDWRYNYKLPILRTSWWRAQRQLRYFITLNVSHKAYNKNVRLYRNVE
jgi:hypothetical protein